jgi:hypothetical protein
MFDGDFDYAARFPGMPGYGAICVDDPDPKWRKEVAKSISDWIKRGATVERVHRDVAAAGMREYMEEQARRKSANETGSLL